ncbi:MAG TPA: hypothetical protein VNN06_08650 [Ramlibacter sp.]|nr:hypothetical protein [Ramlibacter sp.]
MRSMFSKTEALLLLACVGLAALALFGPAVAQPANYHQFADQRVLWGLPFAMDVLSNLAFLLAGAAGAWCLLRLPPGTLGNVDRAMAALFFAGLTLTAAASGWYHWQPDDAGLALDRCAMAVAFAGLLGLAAAGHVSARAGLALGLAMLVLAPLSVRAWSATGNVLPWAVLQFGGMGLILWFALLRPSDAAPAIRWSLVIAAYGAAKLLEAGDHLVFEATGHLVSGHTLKHVAAALAAWPVVAAIRSLDSRQNRAGNAAGASGAAHPAGKA